MDDFETTAELLQALRDRRQEWEALLARVPPERMEQPGAAGEWSVKDIIAHLTAYEQWLVEWLDAIRRGERPAPSVLEDTDIDRRNAAVHAQMKDRPLGEIQYQSRQTFMALLDQVARIPDEDLFNPDCFPGMVSPYFGEGVTLADAISGDSLDHYDEHIPDLEAWIKRRG